MSALGTVVYVLVLGLLFYAVFRSRPAQRPPRWLVSDNGLIIGGGIILPLVILPVLWVLTLRSMEELSSPSSPPELTIEIVGHQWWYEVRYPDEQITLTNEMHIPAGQPVRLRVTSVDVIHSFWVPRLSGKIDMIPGQVNEWWLTADEPGDYRVLCGEFCGLWHTTMQMSIVAHPPNEFAAWLANANP